MMTRNRQIIAELEEKLHRVSWNEGFGCHNRQGFEHLVWPEIAHRARFLVYFDIDRMHALNESFGSYAPVDAMIKQVLSIVRATDHVAGQVKSGDEFVIAMTESANRPTLDPEGLRDRLIQEFAKHNMSATFAIVPVLSMDLVENLEPAIEAVYEQKKARGSTSR